MKVIKISCNLQDWLILVKYYDIFNDKLYGDLCLCKKLFREFIADIK